MPIIEPGRENRTDLDLPVEERLLPVHVPEHVEQYALRLTEQHGGDVEQWVVQCLAFNVRPLLRHDRPDAARTHAVHAAVDAETFAAVQASGRPRKFVRQAIRKRILEFRPVGDVGLDEAVLVDL